ncbi:MAG: phosphotransferase family protein, partial [Pseudomonadota bacterium]
MTATGSEGAGGRVGGPEKPGEINHETPVSGEALDLPLDRLEPYLADRLTEMRPPFRWTRFRGGQSNPTYLVEDSHGARRVLRRKPYGTLLPSAHAIEREYRVMAALAGTGVPVPAMAHLCEDPDVIGAAFYVMAYVEGEGHTHLALPARTPAFRRAVAETLVDTLAAIHGVDVAAAGLAAFGRPGGYLMRQTARWSAQYRASETAAIPAMERLIEALPAALGAVPDETCLVHGDYRLDNLRFAAG